MARQVGDAITKTVLSNDPDLIALRPLIESTSISLAASTALTPIVQLAARQVHQSFTVAGSGNVVLAAGRRRGCADCEPECHLTGGGGACPSRSDRHARAGRRSELRRRHHPPDAHRQPLGLAAAVAGSALTPAPGWYSRPNACAGRDASDTPSSARVSGSGWWPSSRRSLPGPPMRTASAALSLRRPGESVGGICLAGGGHLADRGRARCSRRQPPGSRSSSLPRCSARMWGVIVRPPRRKWARIVHGAALVVIGVGGSCFGPDSGRGGGRRPGRHRAAGSRLQRGRNWRRALAACSPARTDAPGR